MTLFKQLFLGASLAFLVVLMATEGVYIKNAHHYLQEQLASHSQNAATSLGMALPASLDAGDLVRAEVTTDAVFDRGYYQSIRILNAKGETLVLKILPTAPADVPEWFVKLLPMEVPVAESLITKGWHQLGRVVVSSHPNFAYKQLWRTLVEATLSLGVLYLFTLLALHTFLTRILSPLRDIESVAHAISERNFKQVKTIPAARELRSVVSAINMMSEKLQSMIDFEVKQAKRYRDEATKDALTGLENRRGFELKMQSLLTDEGLLSGVLYLIQIADFQKYNTNKGFSEGDSLLKALGDTFISNNPDQEFLCARINGATFALAAFNLSKDESTRLGETLCSTLSEVTAGRGKGDPFVMGYGGAYFADNTVTLKALLAQCDLAMLQSLSAGNSQSVLSELTKPEDDESQGSQYWKSMIKEALKEDRLVILFQSVLGFNFSKPIQIEVVGRLKNSTGEMISAGQFIPMANRHKLSPELDWAVILKLSSILKNIDQANQIAINISTYSIHDPQFVTRVKGALRDEPELAKKLVFEFTEFGVVQDLVGIENFIHEIRQFGAKFAVDNFGLHHSAFEYLQKLKPSYVKLSPSYLTELKGNLENQFFISSVVKITHSLDIKVIALGVEDDTILELLQQLGVDGYQGYITGKLTELN
jgi:EAL domain-containing protein (putative c-di-GMP-specific phosphodiesterase class I)/GGDEF domain-containing protein